MPYKRGSKWVAQVRKDDRRREKVFLTKKQAQDWEAEMRRKPESDWSGKTATVCLGDWYQPYLDFAKTRYTEKTYKEKKALFKRFFAEVDPTLPVEELTRAIVLAYVVKQKEVRSGHAANKDRKNLVAAWNWGMKYLDPPLPAPNPCLVDRMPEIRKPRYIPPEEDFWKAFEVSEGQDRIMLLTVLHLAARRGEVFRMQWADVDFGNSRIRLWTRKRLDGTYEYDWLPMTKQLRQALRWWWENRPIKDTPYVFVSLDDNSGRVQHYGMPFKTRNKFMATLCKKAKVKEFGFHAIRHLTASTLFKFGSELGVIQTVLRHRSPSTTERYLRSIGLERVREAL